MKHAIETIINVINSVAHNDHINEHPYDDNFKIETEQRTKT